MKSLRVALVIMLGAVLAFSVTGCGKKKSESAAAEVNGEAIPMADFNKQVKQMKEQYADSGLFEGKEGEQRLLSYKERILDNMITQELLLQAAKDRKISISKKDIEAQIKSLKTGYKDDAAFKKALKDANMTQESLEEQLRMQMITQRLIESLAQSADISDAAVQKYYDTHKTQFTEKAAKRPAQILFRPEDKAVAEKVLAEIKSGGDFAALAKQYSIDETTKSKGGDLGWPGAPRPTEVEQAINSLKVGQVSGLVQSSYGWYILKVLEERPSRLKPLSEVKDQVKQLIAGEARSESYQKFITAERKKATIKVYVKGLGGLASKPSK